MPSAPLTSHRTGDVLRLQRGNAPPHWVNLAGLTEAWLVRVGDGFSGPDASILILVTPGSATPLPLEHHSLWTDLLAELRELAAEGMTFQAETARLPREWRTDDLAPFASARVAPVARPRTELEAARSAWAVQPLPSIPETMP